MPQNTSPSAVTRHGAPMTPISAARAHSALSRALLASLSARSNARRRIDAACGQQGAERRAIADRQALAEFGDKDPAREIGARVAFKRERDARGEQARLRKRLGPLERNAHGAARPLEVAPHVAALGRIDVERRVAPALRHEDRPEQERAPDKAHASLFGERGDPKRRRIGIGARELVPELGARPSRLLERPREFAMRAGAAKATGR